MSRKTSGNMEGESTIKKILRRTFGGEWNKEEKKYAERQLKKIYSCKYVKIKSNFLNC